MISYFIHLIRTGPGPLKYLGNQEAAILLMLLGAAAAIVILKTTSSFFSLGRRQSNLNEKLRIKWARFKYRNRTDGVLAGYEWLSDNSRLRHTHVVGATGSGKTVLVEQLISQDIKRGYGCLIIDAKGERELYLRTKALCKSLGREKDLHLISATYDKESSIWNPCDLGSVSELQSKFYNSAIYDQFHYAKAVEGGLLKAFSTLERERGGDAFTIKDIAQTLKREFKGSASENLEGLYLDLENLAGSEWAKILGVNATKEVEARTLQMIDIIQQGKILFVDLPTEAKAVQSSRIGRLLLQEVMLISGLRKAIPNLNRGKPFCIYVDEFDAFATPSFATFLNKGRSSGFMITIAHQTLSQLDRIGEGFRGEVMGNCNGRFVFRQDEPDDAETWAKFIGTRSAVKQTYRTSDGRNTGESSNREAEEYVIHPNVIKQLDVGECVFFSKSPRRLSRMRIPHEPQEINLDLNVIGGPEVVQRIKSNSSVEHSKARVLNEAMKGL